MRLIDTFRLSTRMFKTNRLRALLAILAVSAGTGTILFLMSLGYGLRQILINQIAASDTINIILLVFGAVALFVSAIGMFNTMTIALLERAQEIGIMKALGASRQDIRKLFLAESIIIGFLGGMFGIIIGYIGIHAVNTGVNALAKSMGGQMFDLFYIPASFIIFILVFSTAVGLLTGLYPAKRAAELNPLEALRYK